MKITNEYLEKMFETFVDQTQPTASISIFIPTTRQEILIQAFEKTNKNRMKVMQYVGLKDMDGKEIYEGDVLNFKEWNHGTGKLDDAVLVEVDWSDDLVSFCLYPIGDKVNSENKIKI